AVEARARMSRDAAEQATRAEVAREQAERQQSEEERRRFSQLVLKLDRFGLNERNHRLLCLWPAVNAAWSDGKIQSREQMLLLEQAAEMGFELDSTEALTVNRWLGSPPEPGRFGEAIALLRELSQHEGFEDVTPETLQSALVFARRVAGAAGGVLGIGKLSSAESALLERMEQELIA